MLQTTNRKLPTTMLIYKPKGNLRSIAIMIEVNSRRMECILLTSNYSQMPAVALQWFPHGINKALELIFFFLRCTTDTCHGGSIVVCLASTHHYVQAILLKLIENRLNNFVCIFSVQWKEI